MLTLRTAKGYEIPITWIGISDFDGSLRFETTETNMPELFQVFNDPEHTEVVTRVFDEGTRDFEGFTAFKGIERMGNGNTVIRMMAGEKAKYNNACGRGHLIRQPVCELVDTFPSRGRL